MYLFRRGIYLFEGTGGGSGEGQGSGDGAGSGTSDGTQNTGRPNAEPTIPLARFNEVNNQLKQLRQQADAAERERQQREADAEKEQGRWKDLAERHEAKVKELEPIKAKAERYEAALTKHLESQRKDLPAHITVLLDKLDPADQLEWLAENAEAVTGKPAPKPGTVSNPKPAADPDRKEQVAKAKQELAASGRYEL